eukprot:5329972-Prymnesium_polylepis.2
MATSAAEHAGASKYRTDSKERQAKEKLDVTKQLMQDRKVTLRMHFGVARLCSACAQPSILLGLSYAHCASAAAG